MGRSYSGLLYLTLNENDVGSNPTLPTNLSYTGTWESGTTGRQAWDHPYKPSCR